MLKSHYNFRAGHRLVDVPSGHPCARFHEHRFEVRVTIEREEKNVTRLSDYSALMKFRAYLRERFDQTILNSQVNFSPTAENLAFYFYEWLGLYLGDRLIGVEVLIDEQIRAEYNAPPTARPAIEITMGPPPPPLPVRLNGIFFCPPSFLAA